MPRKTGMAGAFTLVEVVLAVALSALLLTIVYWTYFSINRSIDAATENQDALDTGRTLSELIKRDIRAISPAQYPLVGKNNVIEKQFVRGIGVRHQRLVRDGSPKAAEGRLRAYPVRQGRKDPREERIDGPEPILSTRALPIILRRSSRYRE